MRVPSAATLPPSPSGLVAFVERVLTDDFATEQDKVWATIRLG